MMKEPSEGVDEGIKVEGELIRTDDQATTANSKRGLQKIMNETELRLKMK